MGVMLSQIPALLLFTRPFIQAQIKETSKLRVTGVTGEFPTQMASNAENVPIWWRHHVTLTQRIFANS